jgi:hypothetical protein
MNIIASIPFIVSIKEPALRQAQGRCSELRDCGIENGAWSIEASSKFKVQNFKFEMPLKLVKKPGTLNVEL